MAGLPSVILRLQRQAGNAAVNHMLRQSAGTPTPALMIQRSPDGTAVATAPPAPDPGQATGTGATGTAAPEVYHSGVVDPIHAAGAALEGDSPAPGAAITQLDSATDAIAGLITTFRGQGNELAAEGLSALGNIVIATHNALAPLAGTGAPSLEQCKAMIVNMDARLQRIESEMG